MKKIITAVLLLNFYSLIIATPKLFVFIGPSGVGKTTLIQKLQESRLPLDTVVTTTTRTARPHEIEGKDYFFLSKDEFLQKQQHNEFFATTTIYGNCYGIYKKYIAEKLQSNRSLACCLTADVRSELKNALGNQVITIFIVPPSLQELEKRLRQRNSEDDTALQKRLQNAALEMKLQDSFDFKIMNDDLETAIQELMNIFNNHT